MTTARIDRFTSRVEAEMACALLEANGFDAWLSVDDAGGVHPELPYGVGGTVVVVPAEQLSDAIAMLDAGLGEHDLTAAFDRAESAAAEPDHEEAATATSVDADAPVGGGPRLVRLVALGLVVLVLAAVIPTLLIRLG